MKTICVIPARFASSRLPGKPLALIGNRTMIQCVYERAVQAEGIDRVLVATDDQRIADAVIEFGGDAVLTDPGLQSGTDRVAAAVEHEAVDVVINLQGDEPFIDPRLLTRIADVFKDPGIQIATPVRAITSAEELTNPNLVRVVRDRNHFALYFSRAVLPYLRDEKQISAWYTNFRFYRHIGIYAYRSAVLKEITKLPPSPLEQAEKLEQLRMLENGYNIYTVETEYESISVDTPADLEHVNQFIKNKK